MALLYSSAAELGAKAHPFSLLGVDGNTYTLDSFQNKKALLIVFMCNHCPYVIAVHARLSALATHYAEKGIAVLGVNSNDPNYKEADSFQNMKKVARDWNLSFPYGFDETQAVARSYDAVCTPDPYLYENLNGEFILRYRGRIDDHWQDETKVREQSLKIAMEAILNQTPVSQKQIPSMGCSIKWKEHTEAALAKKLAKGKL